MQLGVSMVVSKEFLHERDLAGGVKCREGFVGRENPQGFVVVLLGAFFELRQMRVVNPSHDL